ncbi:FCD domain-containing protein [Streptomyces sp. R44]|uniref:FCD domain-containing protein n=1 Tax=Streptomyces sp. R44 TaxID=3238633 RepID=A0AB39TBW4_9ACTN
MEPRSYSSSRACGRPAMWAYAPGCARSNTCWWRGRIEEGALARAWREHRAIYEAVAARQPELAQARATVRVAEVEQWLRGTLDAVESERT